MRRLEQAAIVAAVLLAIAVPIAVHGWPVTFSGNVGVALLLLAGCGLAWWRTRPRVAAVLALGLSLVATTTLMTVWIPDTGYMVLSGGFLVLALGWSGRLAWLCGLAGAAYLVVFSWIAHTSSWVAPMIFTAPPFVAGTVLRLRREAADELSARVRELDEERELFTQLALRHERSRIAGELHDIIGHAISVMVVQAAAGQRLVDKDPDRARLAFEAISESARQGSRDLAALVELLGGGAPGRADLSLVEEVVRRATGSGLDVNCRFEGDQAGVSGPVAHLAIRIVQESLTNALRYAPGSAVRIVIGATAPTSLSVRVENDVATASGAQITGTGQGLRGLRERVQAVGGHLHAGATGAGGWAVEAVLPDA